MSKKNNANTDFYKTAGREHTDGSDKGDAQAAQKQKLTKQNTEQARPGHKGEKK
jgi:hypothetical protein